MLNEYQNREFITYSISKQGVEYSLNLKIESKIHVESQVEKGKIPIESENRMYILMESQNRD